MLDLCIYRIIFISVVLHSARQNKVKRSREVSSHQLNVSLCEREDMSQPDLRSAATLLDIYRIK